MSTQANFLIIGANKGGTTSLFGYLGQHPDVFLPAVKEPMFFNYYQRDGEDGQFRTADVIKTFASYERLFQGSEDFAARGEASTSYLANPSCAANIYDYNPEMKLIAILRCPIERAWSNYLMYVRWNDENRTFSQAVQEELTGVQLPQGKRYIELGRYLESLQTFAELFGRRQLRIYLNEDLRDRPVDTYRDICTFLDIDANFEVDMSMRHNTNDAVAISPWIRSLRAVDARFNFLQRLPSAIHERVYAKPRMRHRDWRRLKELYQAEIDGLSGFLDRDLSHWLAEQ